MLFVAQTVFYKRFHLVGDPVFDDRKVEYGLIDQAFRAKCPNGKPPDE